MPINALIFKADGEDDDGKDPYLSKLASVGVEAALIPVIRFAYCNLQLLGDYLGSPNSFSGIVLGSPRCVHAVQLCQPKHNEWSRRKCYCVGEKTGSLARRLLGWEPVGQNCGNGLNLAKFIIETGEKGPLLIPQSNIARQMIVNTLTDAGIDVVAVEVYLTESNPELPKILTGYFTKKDPPNCLIYFSPSGVNSTLPIFHENNISLSSFKVGAIGSTTSSYLEEKGIGVDFIAEKPTPEHLAEALLKILP